MRKVIGFATLAVLSGVAAAQGYPQQQTVPVQQASPQQQPYPYPPQQPYPQQYPQPQPYGYYQQPRPMQIQLTVDDQWLMQRGYITDGEMIGGGLAALFVGFGSGQAIEGRWGQTGYIFTLGEVASFGAIIWGIVDVVGEACLNPDRGYSTCNRHEGRGEVLVVGGLIGFSALRIWEIVDAFAGPGAHNRDLNDLRARMGMPPIIARRIVPYVAPGRDRDGGGVAGIAMRF